MEMHLIREERVNRTMNETGQDRMQAIGTVRSRDAVNDSFRSGKLPSWAVRPSWAD